MNLVHQYILTRRVVQRYVRCKGGFENSPQPHQIELTQQLQDLLNYPAAWQIYAGFCKTQILEYT